MGFKVFLKTNCRNVDLKEVSSKVLEHMRRRHGRHMKKRSAEQIEDTYPMI